MAMRSGSMRIALSNDGGAFGYGGQGKTGPSHQGSHKSASGSIVTAKQQIYRKDKNESDQKAGGHL